MDFQDEKLSIISILLISGLSCLAFAGLMKLLEGTTHPLFLKAGVIGILLASLLSLLKYILSVIDARKHPSKQNHSARIGS